MAVQPSSTIEIDYLCDGTERVVDMATIANTPYSNTTIAAGLSSGSGITYTTGTGFGWQPVTTAGTISAKDVDLDGRSLKDTIQAIERRLNMLIPNPEIEAEWEQLKLLGDAYRKLEAECVEKSKMWKTLKKT